MRILLTVFFAVQILFLNSETAEAQITISPDSKASFKFGSSFLSVYASVRNAPTVNATEWQFRYDPLFAPVVDENAELVVELRELDTVSIVSFTVLLDSLEAQDAAFTSVKEVYPDDANELNRQNVRALEVSNTTISIPELDVFLPGYRLRSSTMASFDGQSRFTVSLIKDGKEARSIDELRSVISELIIEFQVTFDARTGKENSITIAMSKAKDTQLYEELNGLNSSIVYVHRDQFRRMFETATTSLVATEILEAGTPENDRIIFEQVVERFTTPISTEDFDDVRWSKTYSANDIEPNQLKKILNEVFEKDQSKETWKRKDDIDSSGKFSFLDIFSAEGEGDLELTDEGLKEFLRERKINVEIEADGIIIPKSLELLQIDVADFFADRSVTRAVVYLEGNQRSQNHSLYVREALSSGRAGRIRDYKLLATEACPLAGYENMELLGSCRTASLGTEVIDRQTLPVRVCGYRSIGRNNNPSKASVDAFCQARFSADDFEGNISLDRSLWSVEAISVTSFEADNGFSSGVLGSTTPQCPSYQQGRPVTSDLYVGTLAANTAIGPVRYSCGVTFVRSQPVFGQHEDCGVTLVPNKEAPIYQECRHPSHGFEE